MRWNALLTRQIILPVSASLHMHQKSIFSQRIRIFNGTPASRGIISRCWPIAPNLAEGAVRDPPNYPSGLTASNGFEHVT